MTSSLAIDPLSAVWSVSEAERADALANRPLLVLMHGRGSHEHDLYSLVPLLPENAVIVSLRAPLPLGDGFTWFPVGEPGRPSAVAADSACDAILEWLDTVSSTRAVGLFGFSQGAAMAIHLMRRAPERFAAYVALAGFVIPGEQPADPRLESLRPPVFWGRDVGDPVIPHDAIERTAGWLPTHSTLTTALYPGIGHSVSRDELDDVRSFLASTALA